MRNIPLKAFAKRSPIKNGEESKDKKHKQMTQKDLKEGRVEGFMHPPYKKPIDLAGNVRYYHGYKWKNQEAKEDAKGVTTNIKMPKVHKDGKKNTTHYHKKK